MLQVFLNVTQFGMQVQQAVEAQRFSSASFPNSFALHITSPAGCASRKTCPMA
jgi:gamma-glutamyltranspeptidase/glutathione hydrolase